MASSEMRGFVFSLVFIVVFSALLTSIPAGFQGTGETPQTVIPIDPNLVSGFSDSENWTESAYVGGIYEYYDLNSRDWLALEGEGLLALSAKIYIAGFLWLGSVDSCRFVSEDGIDRDTQLALTEITTDADEGAVRYSLKHILSGDSGGSLVIYWETDTYDNATHAWNNDELYLLHGVGFDTSATNNIGALLVSLLMLQLPEVPFLVNIFLAVPIWATIVFVLWFVIKEMIPFLG